MKTNFIHISDIHFCETYERGGFDTIFKNKIEPGNNLRLCLKENLNKNIDFILMTGDLVHEGKPSDYYGLFSIVKNEFGDIPLIFLPGNHDNRKSYCHALLGINYSGETLDEVYTVGDLNIITLDTGTSLDGSISKLQIDWLSAQLKLLENKNIILGIHHPIDPNQCVIAPLEYDNELSEIIESSQIMGIFCGHTHKNSYTYFKNKPHITADSMAFDSFLENNVLNFTNKAAYNFCTIEDSKISVQVKQINPVPKIVASFDENQVKDLFK